MIYILGILKEKGLVEYVGKNNLEKQEVIVEDVQKKNFYKIECFSNVIPEIAGLNIGDKILANCYLRGRKYTKDDKTMYFMSLSATWISPVRDAIATPSNSNIQQEITPIENGSQDEEFEDDLPF